MFDDASGGGGGGDDGDRFFSFGGRPMHYILDGHTVKPVSMMTWARWFEHANRRVAESRFRGVWISTVFIGLDHSFEGLPELFETGIFIGGGKTARMVHCERASAWEHALAVHRMACAEARIARSARVLAGFDWRDRLTLQERFERYREGA